MTSFRAWSVVGFRMNPYLLKDSEFRRLWMRHQGLHRTNSFGSGVSATQRIIERLGYVQIDTINVIERAHHHILWSRQPSYRIADLEQLQARKKSVYEYWTHALAYLPVRDFSHSVWLMRKHRQEPGPWFRSVNVAEARGLYRRILREGPISIADVKEDELVEKDHPWASRKPSKRLLQYLFYTGDLTVSRRVGMLKYYDCPRRHFGWSRLPKGSGERDRIHYMIDRALDAQGVVDVDSIIHLRKSLRGQVHKRLEDRAKKGDLVAIDVPGVPHPPMWARPRDLSNARRRFDADKVHVLSPFDPLLIQRGRFHRWFGLDFRFEAYVPTAKRRYGYFACPILRGDRVVALIDMKTDRAAGKALVQKWTSWGRPSKADRAAIEDELDQFEKFQLNRKRR